MKHNKTPVVENELVANEPSTGEDAIESVEDVGEDKICTFDEGNKAELEVHIKDWVEVIDTSPNKECKGQMDEKNVKDVQKNKEEKSTSILHDTDDKNNARRMETYVSFVNSNWKETLTKFKKKNQNPRKGDKKNINKVSEEATGSSKSCSTPEGLLHSMWLNSLAKGEIVIEKGLPRKKSQSPYLIFCKEKEKELSHLTWKEFGVITRKEWKVIGDKEREKFKEKCKELREQEREQFQGKGNGMMGKKRIEKKIAKIKTETVAKKELKKPRSAFSIYMDSLTSEVSKKEDGGDDQKDGGDVKEDAEDFKKLANNQWRRLNKKEKDIFKDKEYEEWVLCSAEVGFFNYL